MKYYISLILMLAFFGSFAQEGRIIFADNEPIDPKRYDGVKGSPYLFEEFVEGTIYENQKNFISGLMLNYNGETNSFEYQKEGNIYELDMTYFVKVEMISNKVQEKYANNISDTTVFIKGLNSNDFSRFYIMVQGGPNVTVFKEFNAYLSERDLENVGKTIKIKNMGTQFLYYMVQGGEPELFKLYKKSVLKTLKDGKQLQDYVKSEGLKLDNEKDLIQLINYYNALDIY